MRFPRLRELFGRPSLAPRPRPRGWPTVELLEQRTVPSTFANVLVNDPARDTTVNDTQSTVALVAVPNPLPTQDTLVAAFNDAKFASSGLADAVSLSTNGGASFSELGRFTNSGGSPALARDAVSGRIYAGFLSQFSGSPAFQGLTFAASADNGNTYPTAFSPNSPSITTKNTVSNLSLAVDNNLASANQGRLFAAFEEIQVNTTSNPVPTGVHFAYSSNGGASWIFPTTTTGTVTTSADKPLTDTNANGPVVVVGTNDDVYVFFLESSAGTNTIEEVISLDGGATWGAAVTVATLTNTNPNGDLSALDSLGMLSTNSTYYANNSYPRAAVNPGNGDLYVTYNDTAVGDAGNVYFVQSSTAGATWTATPVKVNTDATTTLQWNPSIAVTPNGTAVGIFFYSDEADSGGTALTHIGLYGAVGGVTLGSAGTAPGFGNDFPVTSATFPAIAGQEQGIDNMSDFNATVSDEGIFYTAWGDNRDPSTTHTGNNANVRAAAVPLISGQVAFTGLAQAAAEQVATFTTPDSGATDSFAATIFWGDGTSNSGTVTMTGTGTFKVTTDAVHTYAHGGAYEVTITITNDGNSAPTSAIQNVVRVSDATVSDPGFETPTLAPGASQYGGSGSPSSPWTFSGTAGLASNGSIFTSSNPPAPQGNQVAFVQQSGSVSQVVTFAAGTYDITFSAAQRGSGNASAFGQTFQVLVDSTVVGTFTPVNGNYFTYGTATFNVTAGGHTIKFLGTNPHTGDNTALIDNVAVYATGTPQFADNGFEGPGVGSGSSAYAYDPVGSSWTFSGTAGVAGNNSGFTVFNSNAPQGSQVAFLQQTGSMSQAAYFPAGTYAISLSTVQRDNPGHQASVQVFAVEVDGSVVGIVDPSTEDGFLSATTPTFAVAAGTHTVSFVGLNPNGGDNTALIDQVTVAPCAAALAIADPYFNQPAVATGSFKYNPSNAVWTYSGTAGLAANGSVFTSGNLGAPAGTTQVAFVQQTGSVSQMVNFPVAGSYTISFLAAQRGSGNTANQTLQVFVNGTQEGSNITPASTTYAIQTTGSFTILTPGVYLLKIAGINPDAIDDTALVTQVVVTSTAPQFADPNFQYPDVGTGGSAFAYGPTTGAPPADSPWTFAGTAGLAGNGSIFTSGNPAAPAPGAKQVAFVQQTGSILQGVSLTGGTTYAVTFSAAQRANSNGSSQAQTLEVKVVDSTNTLVYFTTITPSNRLYSTYSTSDFLIGSSGTYTVEFIGLNPSTANGGDNTAFIDDVAICASGPQFADPGFETPGVGSGFRYATTSGQPNLSAVSPWTFTGQAGVAGNASAFTSGNPIAPQGEQVAFLQGKGSLSQAVYLPVGTYALSFGAAQRGNSQASLQMFNVTVSPGVMVFGNTVTTLDTVIPPSTGYTTITTAPFTVTTAGSVTFTFAGLNPNTGDNTAFIDAVQINPVA